jgi:hypothetical protein
MRFTDADKLKALMRECALRAAVYPGRVAAKKMKQADADRELAIMRQIAEDYREKSQP